LVAKWLKPLESIQMLSTPLAWRMIYALATGDAGALRELAEAVELTAAVAETPLNSSPWVEIADAIRAAAERKQDVPTRAEVVEAYTSAVAVNCQAVDLRERLARMGFAWLPAPNGRPKKVK
jgi:hypothetical protein